MTHALQRATVVLAASLCITTASASAPPTAAANDLTQPPLSWICPMHPDVVEGVAGTCPICRMALEPVRLDTIWSCPIHLVVAATAPGRCPVCGRDLARITVAVSWQCADGSPALLEPGRCADRSAATIKYTPRPHGNHNAQHGGTFFMAPDNWHHLEGALPRAGVFRIYLYDDYSRPLPRDQIARVTGRITMGKSEIALKADGPYLEATLPKGTLPVELTAMLRFEPRAPEHRFDFAFDRYSEDRAVRPTSAPEVRASSSGRGPSSGAKDDPLALLHATADRIKAAIDRRAYSEIWVPALQAKDAALLIDVAAIGDDSTRRRVEASVGRIVRAAWQLDAVGDLGDAAAIGDAHARFAAAIAELDRLAKR